jgi:hypothetical protein
MEQQLFSLSQHNWGKMRFKYTQSGGKSQLKAGNRLRGASGKKASSDEERGKKVRPHAKRGNDK